MSPIDNLRRRRGVRAVAQVVVLVALLVAILSYQQESTTTARTEAVKETLLVEACDASDARSLQRADLDAACELARDGEIDAAIEGMDVEEPDAVRDALASVEAPVDDEDAAVLPTVDLTPPRCPTGGIPLTGVPAP